MASDIEPTAADLQYTTEEARWVWEEAARVLRLHNELASHYRNGAKDKRAIRLLWESIEAGEGALALIGVRL